MLTSWPVHSHSPGSPLGYLHNFCPGRISITASSFVRIISNLSSQSPFHPYSYSLKFRLIIINNVLWVMSRLEKTYKFTQETVTLPWVLERSCSVYWLWSLLLTYLCTFLLWQGLLASLLRFRYANLLSVVCKVSSYWYSLCVFLFLWSRCPSTPWKLVSSILC